MNVLCDNSMRFDKRTKRNVQQDCEIDLTINEKKKTLTLMCFMFTNEKFTHNKRIYIAKKVSHETLLSHFHGDKWSTLYELAPSFETSD